VFLSNSEKEKFLYVLERGDKSHADRRINMASEAPSAFVAAIAQNAKPNVSVWHSHSMHHKALLKKKMKELMPHHIYLNCVVFSISFSIFKT